VDCVHLAASIYAELGLIPEVPKFPTYSMDGGRHLNASILSGVLARLPGFQRIQQHTIYPGALLVFWMGRVTHHIGVAIDERKFIHALQGPGVIISSLKERVYARRLQEVWIK
jgi:cell wall-associated NlpC family hydrolase